MRTFSLGLAAAALGCAMCLNPQTARAQIEPFIAQIATFGFNFCPNGWAPLNGQLIPINQNQALFALLGTYLRRQRHHQFRAAHRETDLHRDRLSLDAVHRAVRGISVAQLNGRGSAVWLDLQRICSQTEPGRRSRSPGCPPFAAFAADLQQTAAATPRTSAALWPKCRAGAANAPLITRVFGRSFR